MSYHKTLKAVAKAQGKTIKDCFPSSGLTNIDNMYHSLKNVRPKQLKQAIESFECLGAKVQVKITCSNGETFYL